MTRQEETVRQATTRLWKFFRQTRSELHRHRSWYKFWQKDKRDKEDWYLAGILDTIQELESKAEASPDSGDR